MGNKWNEREHDLAKRAKEFNMELRRDDDGCYWLDPINSPDEQETDPMILNFIETHSIGPLDLDEVEDRIVATENRLNAEDALNYLVDQCYKRLQAQDADV